MISPTTGGAAPDTTRAGGAPETTVRTPGPVPPHEGPVAGPLIVITHPGPPVRSWSSSSRLRVGRLPDLPVFLEDESVSRQHAELTRTDDGWVIVDLGSSNGTFLNDSRIGRTGQRVRKGDVLRFGRVAVRVDSAHDRPSAVIKASGQLVRVASTAARSWDEAVGGLNPTGDQWDHRGRQLVKLMRSGYRLSHAPSFEEGLQDVLDDAVAAFDAQRGGVFLADAPGGELVLRCVTCPGPGPHRPPSKTLAGRAFRGARSLLFADCHSNPEPVIPESVARGSMASIICAVIRSPEAPLGVLHLDRGQFQPRFTEADLHLADSLTAALALGVERRQLLDRQQEQMVQTVTALAQAVELRDRYTGGHTHRVTNYALVLAEELGLPAADRRFLQVATPLHDIGKIAVDDAVLRKPGTLSGPEFAQMKEHVRSGVEIVQMIPGLAWALPVVRSHHEKWDGTGYPDGLAGEEIPLSARVVAVADAFDAMTSNRPYRRGMPVETAFAELRAKAGSHFDPRCVDAFCRARARVEALLDQEVTFRNQADLAAQTISRQELDRQTGRGSGTSSVAETRRHEVAAGPGDDGFDRNGKMNGSTQVEVPIPDATRSAHQPG
jgi:HD-GYP domain-containing protein (c-di-GMP phosphodiesterase class II)